MITIMTIITTAPMSSMGSRLDSSQALWDSGRTSYSFKVPEANCSAMRSPRSA